MKNIICYLLLAIVLIGVSCTKPPGLRPGKKKFDDQSIYHKHPPDRINEYLPPPRTCINSFDDFMEIFGKTEILVDSVELENGDHLSGMPINSITYHAVKVTEPNSIFRSQLIVVYNSSGYVQTHFQQVWSLGCLYLDRAIPPFTNLVYKSSRYMINTCFTWGGPQQPQSHLRVINLFVSS